MVICEVKTIPTESGNHLRLFFRNVNHPHSSWHYHYHDTLLPPPPPQLLASVSVGVDPSFSSLSPLGFWWVSAAAAAAAVPQWMSVHLKLEMARVTHHHIRGRRGFSPISWGGGGGG